jgi:hypothetical protein
MWPRLSYMGFIEDEGPVDVVVAAGGAEKPRCVCDA